MNSGAAGGAAAVGSTAGGSGAGIAAGADTGSATGSCAGVVAAVGNGIGAGVVYFGRVGAYGAGVSTPGRPATAVGCWYCPPGGGTTTIRGPDWATCACASVPPTGCGCNSG